MGLRACFLFHSAGALCQGGEMSQTGQYLPGGQIWGDMGQIIEWFCFPALDWLIVYFWNGSGQVIICRLWVRMLRYQFNHIWIWRNLRETGTVLLVGLHHMTEDGTKAIWESLGRREVGPECDCVSLWTKWCYLVRTYMASASWKAASCQCC